MFTVILKIVVEMTLLKYLAKGKIPPENNAYGDKKTGILLYIYSTALYH